MGGKHRRLRYSRGTAVDTLSNLISLRKIRLRPCHMHTSHIYPAQANRGGPCSEYEKKNRKCLHTLVVALALWQEEGMRDDGLGMGQVDSDGGRIPDGTPRTAQKMLDKDAPAYRKGLANCLNTMSVYKFPENLPFGLRRRGATTNANASITYTTSQKTCSGCGRDFPTENQHTVVATRLTEVSAASLWELVTVPCSACGSPCGYERSRQCVCRRQTF